MRKTLIVAAGFGVLLANVALAQRPDDEGLKVGDYAVAIEAGDNNRAWINVASDDERPSMTELRGMVIVLFFWVSWHGGAEALLPYVNMFSYNPQIGRSGGVFTIGVTDADRKATQPLIDGAKIFFPVALESKAAEEYGFRNGFGFVVVGPDGKIIFKGTGGGDLGGMANAIIKAIQESPPTKTHPKEAAICYRRLDEARQEIRAGRYPRAYKDLRESLERSVLGDRLHSKTLEMGDLVEELGYDQLAAFQPLLEQKKYDQAAEMLRNVIRRFRGLDCYKDAKRLYEDLRKENEDFELAAARFDHEDAAARLYLGARDALRSRRIGDCYDKLNKVVTDYSDTEAAEYAEAMLARMKKIDSIWALVRDHQAAPECRPMLARARNLIGQGNLREAEELLRKIMRDCRDTIWAEEAKEELKNMP
jgi:tetratricopeptide (TPR) repeat protein